MTLRAALVPTKGLEHWIISWTLNVIIPYIRSLPGEFYCIYLILFHTYRIEESKYQCCCWLYCFILLFCSLDHMHVSSWAGGFIPWLIHLLIRLLIFTEHVWHCPEPGVTNRNHSQFWSLGTQSGVGVRGDRDILQHGQVNQLIETRGLGWTLCPKVPELNLGLGCHLT